MTTTHNWDFTNPHDGCGLRVTSCPLARNFRRYDLLRSTSPAVWSQLMVFLVGLHSPSSSVRLLASQGPLVCFMWDTLAVLLTERVAAVKLRRLKRPRWESGFLLFGLSPLCGITFLCMKKQLDGEESFSSKVMTANSQWLGHVHRGGEHGLLMIAARKPGGPCVWDLPVPQYCGMNLEIGCMCFDPREPAQMAMLFVGNYGSGPTVVCVVVDVEHSVATSSLDICSSTTCVLPVKQGETVELKSALLMRRNGGSRVFVVAVRLHYSKRKYSVMELEECTGLVREIGSFWDTVVKTTQLSQSTFCVYEVVDRRSYQIWDCSSVETRMIEDGFIYLVGYSGVTVYEVHTVSPIFHVEIVRWIGPVDWPLTISHM
ncbi:hypothetical protein Pelo_14091 [Pelomyxa schiedti]|nr:hypothetical protein Pelo_14091 [Pelomyxa schiedti]